MQNNSLQIVECPRDAMQGWSTFIPTEKKISYLNQLLKVGFDVLDFGSFVSPKAIPQLADTHEVLPHLELSNNTTQLLAIVANLRGAVDACKYPAIGAIGFPFSISETFQLRNTNKTIAASLDEIVQIQALCKEHNKELVIYISMGFGNIYGDPYTAELAISWFNKLAEIGITTIAMADTVGVANPVTIDYIYQHLNKVFPTLTIGAHFHSTVATRFEKLNAAWDAGCHRFDSALLGIGGCPMANDDLVGNMDTETIIMWAQSKNIDLKLDNAALQIAKQMAQEIFIH